MAELPEMSFYYALFILWSYTNEEMRKTLVSIRTIF